MRSWILVLFSLLALNAPPVFAEPAPGRFPWPIKGGVVGQAFGAINIGWPSDFFHPGVDIMAPAGTPIYASRGGKILGIFNQPPDTRTRWLIEILDADGFVWQYVHVDKNGIPAEFWDAFQKNRPVAAGAKIGEVVAWIPDENGNRYDHLHLNIKKWDAYHNALDFLEPYADGQAPRIRDIAVLKGGVRDESHEVWGDYSLLAEISDSGLHPLFISQPYSVAISVDGGALEAVWKFSMLPGEEDYARYAARVYVHERSDGPFPTEKRRYTFDLGFSLEGARRFPRTLGKHRATVVARDQAGNESSQEFQWTVVESPGSGKTLELLQSLAN